jgi:hypothetical protein
MSNSLADQKKKKRRPSLSDSIGGLIFKSEKSQEEMSPVNSKLSDKKIPTIKEEKLFQSVSAANSVYQKPQKPNSKKLQNKFESEIPTNNIQNVLQNVAVQIDHLKPEEGPQKDINKQFMLQNIRQSINPVEIDDELDEQTDFGPLSSQMENSEGQMLESFSAGGGAVNSLLDQLSSISMESFTFDDTKTGDSVTKRDAFSFTSLHSIESNSNVVDKNLSFEAQLDCNLYGNAILASANSMYSSDLMSEETNSFTLK